MSAAGKRIIALEAVASPATSVNLLKEATA